MPADAQNAPSGAASIVMHTACHNVPNGGYTRGLPEQTHCAAQRALEEIGSRIGTTASRDAVIELEQGQISRSW